VIADLRTELAAAGLPVTGDGERWAVRPGEIGSLARAVAILRRRGGPLELVDFTALDRIVAIDAATGIARVEAGCRVEVLEAAVRKSSATLGPLLPSVRKGSVGAWLAGPTRGERGILGARRETAALAVSVILADGRIAESRAAPRSATGPDLDHLALGGEGRLCVIAGAVIRLFPGAAPCVVTFRVPSLADAVDGVARLCRDRLEPARAVARGAGNGALLALSWEGPVSGPVHRARAIRAIDRYGWPLAEDIDPGEVFEGSAARARLEVDATWESLAPLVRDGRVTAVGLVGLHAGGAFAVVESAEAPEALAEGIRAPGLRVIAPRALRDTGPGWDAMGASAVWQRLSAALDVEAP
jgi:FAD/FMN-containing dehydrogenase